MFRSPYERILSPVQTKMVGKKDVKCRRRYKCTNCPKKLHTETELAYHNSDRHRKSIAKLLSSPDKSDNLCPICLITLEPEDKVAHFKQYHLQTRPEAKFIEREIYICDCCSIIFFQKDFLIIHMMKRKGCLSAVQQFHCSYCDKTIMKQSIFHHLSSHNLDSVSSCPICCTYQENRISLHQHMTLHKIGYKCWICSYETTAESGFSSHILSKHNGDIDLVTDDMVKKCFVTSVCYKRKYVPTLAYHGIGLRDPLSICILCRAICVTDEERRRHMSFHVPKQDTKCKTNKCSCGEEFSTRLFLKHHVFKSKGTHKVIDE